MARRNKGEEREIAAERIERLVALAEEAVLDARLDRANRYAELAWRVKTRYQMRRSALDGRICRGCLAFLRPGATSRVRLRQGRRVTTCLACGAVRRKVLSEGARSAVDGRPDEP